MFLEAGDIAQFSTALLRRNTCALLNREGGGVVYLGVDRNAVVKGVHITRKQVSV